MVIFKQMYGPPADPRQRIAPVEIFDSVEAYLVCFILGALLTAWGVWKKAGIKSRAALFIAGQTVILTAPLTYFVDTYVYGSFPTIDKAGSMAFFAEGVHRRMMAHPIDAIHDPAASLIGVHVGHLWVTEAFALLFSTIGAFNIQALLYPMLGWWSAWWLFQQITHNPRISMLMGFPYGLGLHVFRDLNWYTIEKAAIFWLPLFAGCLFRAFRDGGRWRTAVAVCLVISAWMNLYMGMLNTGILVLSMVVVTATQHPRRNAILGTGMLSLLALSPLALWQWLIMQGGPQLGTPDDFLWQRAALDTFSIYPLEWNRLEAHRALNVIALAVGLWGFWRSRLSGIVRFAALAALVALLLALGPNLWSHGPENPVFMAARAIVPGFWRMAKPEVFFHLTWLFILGVAAFQADRSAWSKRTTTVLYGLFVLGWIIMIRTHPAYPPMTIPLNVKLVNDWESHVFEP